MNAFTQLKQVTRLDYWGQPYTAVVIDDKRRDYADLWREFAARFNSQPTRDTTGQHGTINGEWMEKQAEKQLNDIENGY